MTFRLHHSTRLVPLLAAILTLASCGGGGDDPPATAANAGPEKAQAVFTPAGAIPADANVRGVWSEVIPWPLIAVHAVLMPDGRMMTYGTDGTGRQTGNFIYDVWDPEQGLNAGHLTLPNATATDIFCSSQLVLPNGDAVFVAGGDNWTGTGTTNTGNNNSNLFSVSGNSLTRGNNMNRPRWYSSSTTLLNGDTYIQGGSGGTDFPEVRQADGSFRLLTGAGTSAFDFMYPRNFVAADGRVFGYDSAGRMYYVNTVGSGAVSTQGQFGAAYTGSDASAAMFRPGRILQFGGNSAGALVIDIRNGAPVVTPTQSMSSQRRLVTATLLADGKVLATGGSRTWNQLDQVNNSAEIWNPDTGTWSVGASGVQARLYHSTALLMPDATVMVMGGGAPGPQNNLNAELYYPPYLFAAGGTMAERLAITSAPTVLDIGRTYGVDITGSATPARVVLVKTGSVTHSWNMEQRFIELTFTRSGNHLNVQAPTRAGDAPPGFYMLFVIDSAGVPSVAKMMRMNVAAVPNPQTTPTLVQPADQTTALGSSASLALSASDPNGDAMGYGASGLPPGLVLDGVSGVVSGAPTATGSYNVVVAASDGVNTATASFTWTVTSDTGFTLGLPVPPDAAAIGSTVTYTASATGVNPRFQWDFGDGTPVTAPSTSPSATHTYAQAGLYTVTLIAVDDSGVEKRVSVLQTVRLPLLAGTPSASSNIAVEAPATGHARVWVVNQDNDSVSVFDAVTRARLAEVAVGAAPRTLAVAPNGQVWVSNKQGASLSVIDTATLAVSRTIALPRGSQPFGVAISAATGQALVVLEGTGQLLKFSTSTYAQTGSLAVGANARHVSLSADGASAYVSRFITPPLPGEATATVAPSAATGGELLTVGTAGMTLLRRTVLAHSDKPDAENQGRGVPNYLGAAAVSPDGVSAWVPSKQDNVQRGMLRDGLPLNFQNTVRAISSRVMLASGAEDLPSRIDHDNASLASAALFDAQGIYLYVALETSREVVVVDAHGGRELFRIATGRAPQGLALSPDGLTLFVNHFMDRTVGAYDLRPLRQQGLAAAPLLGAPASVSSEKLAANALIGKQLFYDARDPRLARDRYMSCASCHNDGGQDGRVWDLTGFGEGLRNTIALRGRGAGHGFLHWSNNFDEVQDFEGQIRNLAGGTGLMDNAAFNSGTRSQPLGDRKAGLSTDLDALAAYLASLNSFDAAPARPGAATLSAAASEGKVLFASLNCVSCHAGTAFTGSGENTLSNVGTVKPASGKRLNGTLAGIDVPTLRDVWASAPYLHDGSADTLEAAVRAHNGVTIADSDLARLTAYLREIGGDEVATAPAGSGSGLAASYFNNLTLTAPTAVNRTEAVDFDWGTAAPGAGVNADNFSVRWTGTVTLPATGSYRFQTTSDDGMRLWVNGVQVINNWTDHGPTVDTSAAFNFTAGQKVDLTLEFYERGGGATMRLRWLTPGETAYVAVPASRLAPPVQTTGAGLSGSYFNNAALTGNAVLARVEAIDFNWGTAAPGPGVLANGFSARWTGTVMAATGGLYRFQTQSDDGVRVWVNGVQVINNWTDHAATLNTSGDVSLVAGQRYTIRVEYYEKTGGAVMRLRWRLPGSTSYVAIPAANLYTN